MRKITKQSAQAMKNGENFKGGNMNIHSNGNVMDLHGNTIAIYDRAEGLLTIRDAGWTSNTTKERLNGLLTEFNIKGGISQKDFTWYFVVTNVNRIKDDTAWNGERLEFTEVLREEWTGSKTFKVEA